MIGTFLYLLHPLSPSSATESAVSWRHEAPLEFMKGGLGHVPSYRGFDNGYSPVPEEFVSGVQEF